MVFDNHRVTVLDNLVTGVEKNLDCVCSDIEFVKGDIRDHNLMARLVDRSEIVYHMAATVGVDRVLHNDTEVSEIDYRAAVELFKLAAFADVETFLFASSSEAYGKFPQDRLPMKEDDIFTPDTVYGFAKYTAELELLRVIQETDMAGVSVRYFNVFGPKQTLNGYAVPTFVKESLNGGTIELHGDGEQTRDMTYIDDAVELTIAVADPKYSSEVFNIGTGDQVSMIDLAEQIIELSGATHTKTKFILERRPSDLYHKQGSAKKILSATGLKAEKQLLDGLSEVVQYRKEYPYDC